MSDKDTAEIIQHTGKSADEALPETLGFINQNVDAGFTGSLLVLISDINGISKTVKFLEIGGQYLFPIAFALKVADLFFYIWKFAQSSNRNISRTTNLFLKVITTVLIGLAVFLGASISAVAAPILFCAAIGVDFLFSAGKAIYFGFQALTTNDPQEKALCAKKAWDNGIRAGMSFLLGTAIVLGLVFAPIVGTAIMAAVAVVAIAAAVALVTLGVIGIVNRIRAARALKEAMTKPDEIELENKNENKNENENEHEQYLENADDIKNAPDGVNDKPVDAVKRKPIYAVSSWQAFALSPQKYHSLFANKVNLLRPIEGPATQSDKDALKSIINDHINKIQTIKDADEDTSFVEKYIWSEGNKRQNKIDALYLLIDFIDKFDDIINKKKNITIGKPFNDYKNTNDLIMQFDKHITHNYPKAYESYFKEIGDVEALFKQAYKLLVSQARYGIPSNDVSAQPSQDILM